MISSYTLHQGGRNAELTFPGKGGILTLVLSLSKISLKASKSEYRSLTTEWRSLNAGMFVFPSTPDHVTTGKGDVPCKQSRSLCTSSFQLRESLGS